MPCLKQALSKYLLCEWMSDLLREQHFLSLFIRENCDIWNLSPLKFLWRVSASQRLLDNMEIAENESAWPTAGSFWCHSKTREFPFYHYLIPREAITECWKPSTPESQGPGLCLEKLFLDNALNMLRLNLCTSCVLLNLPKSLCAKLISWLNCI